MLKNLNNALYEDDAGVPREMDFVDSDLVSRDENVNVSKGTGINLALNEAIRDSWDESDTSLDCDGDTSWEFDVGSQILNDFLNIIPSYKEFAADTMATYFAETRALVFENEMKGAAPLDSMMDSAEKMSVILHDYLIIAFGNIPESRITDDTVKLSLIAQEIDLKEFLCFEDLGTNVVVDYVHEHVFYENHRFVHFENGDSMLVETIDYIWFNGILPKDRENDVMAASANPATVDYSVLDALEDRQVWHVDVPKFQVKQSFDTSYGIITG